MLWQRPSRLLALCALGAALLAGSCPLLYVVLVEVGLGHLMLQRVHHEGQEDVKVIQEVVKLVHKKHVAVGWKAAEGASGIEVVNFEERLQAGRHLYQLGGFTAQLEAESTLCK